MAQSKIAKRGEQWSADNTDLTEGEGLARESAGAVNRWRACFCSLRAHSTSLGVLVARGSHLARPVINPPKYRRVFIRLSNGSARMCKAVR